MITVEWCEWLKIINKSFNEVRKKIDQFKYRYIILYGGRGSSKSDFITKYLIFRCITDSYFRFILIRNNYNTIKDSQYQSIKDIIGELGLSELFEFKVQPLEIICRNGNKFLARGCDDTTRLKSVKDPTGAWYEEDIPSEADFITITTSIRTGKADQLMEIFTINPEVDGDFQDSWFWNKFFKGQSNKSFESAIEQEIEGEKVNLGYIAHHSTYHDNRWLPASFKAFLEALKKQDPYYYTIYCLGEWGNRITGGAFYKAFNRGLTVTRTEYNPSIPLHISFDFNVNPYMTATIWQVSGNMVYNIGEITAVSPKNTTMGTCTEIKNRYPNHSSGMFIYGDASGRNEDTKMEKGHNNFTIIEHELRDYKPTLRVPSSNPSVSMRGKWVNTLFSDLRDIKVFISEQSPLFITDLLNLKEASDGTKFKQKYKDEKTQVTSEKYGHCFTGETLITTIDGDKRIDSIEIGDWVLTRYGYKKVTKTFNNGLKPINTYSIGGIEITCTPEHKLWTKESGFINASALIEWNTFCIFNKELNTWKETQLYITARNSIDTYLPLKGQTGFIIQGISKLMGCLKNLDSTFINICARKAKSLKDSTYIILMRIHLITISKTLHLLMGNNTYQNTLPKRIERTNQDIRLASMQEAKRLNGINQKKEGRGMLFMLKRLLRKTQHKKSVLNVDQITLDLKKTEQQTVNIVQGNASQDLGQESTVNLGSGILKQSASVVDVHLLNTNGQSKEPVLGVVANVYDIEVEDYHEYFANGILVHNCTDSMDYFLCEAFKSDYITFQKGGTGFKPVISQRFNRPNY